MSLVMDKLKEQYDFILTKYPNNNVIGIFLVGSQNYRTDINTSDVDSKVLITPTLKEIYENKRGENKTYKTKSGEVTVKDIRCFLKELKKQNINIIETLFTDFCIVNEPYKNIIEELRKHRNEIAVYDRLRSMKSTKGIAFQYYNKIFGADGKVNPKHVANLIRLENYVKNYIENKEYLECIQPKGEQLEFIKQIRAGELGQSSLIQIADGTINSINILIDAYEKRNDIPNPNFEIEILLDSICKEIIDTSFFIEYASNGEI